MENYFNKLGMNEVHMRDSDPIKIRDRIYELEHLGKSGFVYFFLFIQNFLQNFDGGHGVHNYRP
jgi:hypothetical protein